jgi:hypothetical protein
MLWYKGWFETRWRFAFSLCLVALSLVFLYWTGTKAQPPGANPVMGVVGLAVMSVVWMAAMLAGAGINTQPGFQAAKGLHGSTYFTLSLPVSRFRLLAVRSGLGWLQLTSVIAVLCCGLWIVSKPLRASATPLEMLEFAVVLVAFGSAFYSISVLLRTFLDDMWRVWGTVIALAVLWLLGNLSSLPRSANIFRAVGEGSPLLAHVMPWAAVAVAVGMTLVFFWMASRVVRLREY